MIRAKPSDLPIDPTDEEFAELMHYFRQMDPDVQGPFVGYVRYVANLPRGASRLTFEEWRDRPPHSSH